jgi:hypothetical protein
MGGKEEDGESKKQGEMDKGDGIEACRRRRGNKGITSTKEDEMKEEAEENEEEETEERELKKGSGKENVGRRRKKVKRRSRKRGKIEKGLRRMDGTEKR